ncbi:DUF1902 domain-containing protein [bacterium]|nr:DUF1902 domain-containing protein [bacterium]
MRKEIRVKAFWDAEAGVWVAQSKDVPGLITEAETMENLVAKLHVLIPELLEANGMVDDKGDKAIPFHLFGERIEKALRLS